MDGPGDSVTLVVAGCFHIGGRGWVLAPALPVDRFASNARLELTVVDPGGEERNLAGRFLVQHLSPTGGGSTWQGVIRQSQPDRDRAQRPHFSLLPPFTAHRAAIG